MHNIVCMCFYIGIIIAYMCTFGIIIVCMCMFLFFLLLELNLNSVTFNLVHSNYLLHDWEKGVGGINLCHWASL